MREKRKKQVNFLGPMLLIFVGCILLLNTLGIVDWSIWWKIVQLWPVFLIAAGLELLIGRRSTAASFLVSLVVLFILVGALLLMGVDLGTAGLVSQEIRQLRGDATTAEITINPAVGMLRLDSLPESADLILGEILLGKDEQIQQEFTSQGGRATYALKSEGESWQPFAVWDDRRAWDLGLSPGVALDLESSLALGQTELDLNGLSLSDLSANMGLGWTEIRLPAQGSFQGSISQGLGGVTIIIPEGMELRLDAGTALVLRQLPDDFRSHSGDVFTTPGYDSASDRVDLDVGLAIGVVTVRYSE